MDGFEAPLHLTTALAEPYVHVDNRALVLHDGRNCVMYGRSSFPWLAETLRVLLEERRATRQQSSQVFGGYLHDDGRATLYAGTVHHLVTTTLAPGDLETLHARLGHP
jgi:hypothetical protein